jgi:hypothetical protein
MRKGRNMELLMVPYRVDESAQLAVQQLIARSKARAAAEYRSAMKRKHGWLARQ